MTDFKSLASVLGYSFKNKALIEQAFTLGFGDHFKGYERLEFVGDRVLGLVVAQMLFETYPNEKEGDLARRFADLTRAETLCIVAEKLNFFDYIIASNKTDVTISVLSDICESVIAAIYLDAGLQEAEKFIHLHWTPLMQQFTKPPIDAKTKLQEWVQARGLSLPVYTELNRTGPAHNPYFVMQVEVIGVGKASAEGNSKKIASQNAASVFFEKVVKNG